MPTTCSSRTSLTERKCTRARVGDVGWRGLIPLFVISIGHTELVLPVLVLLAHIA